MKKRNQDIGLFKAEISIDKNPTINTIKTTNINILLNRVRLGKKKDLRKRIIFLSFLILVISLISFFLLN